MMTKPILSSKTTIARTIAWLNLHGLPVLPVAPLQDSAQFPLIRNGKADRTKPAFTGKNPSYLDADGKPHLLPHRHYQTQLPKQSEIDRWFRNSSNGIMTMGGWGGIYWIDIDVKRYSSRQSCDRAVLNWLDRYPILNQTLIEKTHSGGWRFAVKCPIDPGFTNFRFHHGPKHVGELLGFGRLTVLAPTIGPSGNPYESIQRVEPILIDSFESIGIQTTQKPKVVRPFERGDYPIALSGVPHLTQVVCCSVQRILSGMNVYGDRSYCLLVAALELYGWVNWTKRMGFSIAGNPDSLLLETAQRMEVEGDRLQRILKGQHLDSCVPAIYQAAGQEATLGRWGRSYLFTT